MANTSHSNFANFPSLFKGVPWMVVYTCEAVLILAGNSITIYIFWSIRKRLKRTSYLLINLAVADFLVGVSIALWLWHYVAGTLERKTIYGVGETAIVVDIIGITSSVLSLALISLERMFAMLWPFRHRLLSKRSYHVSVGFVWFFTGINVLLNILFPAHLAPTEHYFMIFNSFLFISSVVIITGSYLAIWITTRRNQIHGTTPRQMEQNRKLTKTLFLVTAASIITCLPYGITVAFAKDFFRQLYSYRVQIIIVAQYANSFLNPVIYCFRMPEFKKSLKKLICCCPSRRPLFNGNTQETSNGIILRSVTPIESF